MSLQLVVRLLPPLSPCFVFGFGALPFLVFGLGPPPLVEFGLGSPFFLFLVWGPSPDFRCVFRFCRSPERSGARESMERE